MPDYRVLLPDLPSLTQNAEIALRAVTSETAGDVFLDLVHCLVLDVSVERRVPPRGFTPEALTVMRALPWRGNPTELRYLIVQLLTAGRGGEVQLEEILDYVRIQGEPVPSAPRSSAHNLKQARLCFERDYIRAVLERHGWRMSDAARTLGIQRTNLYRKARQLGILRPVGRTGRN